MKMVRFMNTMILDVGRYMTFVVTLNLYLVHLKYCRDKIYICLYEPTNDAKYILEGNNIVYFS